jgi:hypothetical protein
MDKIKFKAHVVQLQQHVIQQLEERIQSIHGMVDIDDEDIKDPDDFSHQTESSEFEKLIKSQLFKAKRENQRLEDTNFSTKKTVEPGAIIQTGKFNFFIGIATTPFEYEELHVVGVSPDAPIYPSMAGKKKGESFSFGGHNYEIIELH